MQGHNQINPLTAADLFVEITATEAEIISGGGERSTGLKSYSVANDSALENLQEAGFYIKKFGNTVGSKDYWNSAGDRWESRWNSFKGLFS